MKRTFTRRTLLLYATIFYFGMAAIAYLWAWFVDGPLVMRPGTFIFNTLLENLVIGLVLALGLHLLTRLMTGRVAWSDALMTWFESELGHIKVSDALILALLSGFAEELLFRGAMQPSWGLGPATILFALVHWPPDKRLRAWTWMAGFVGLLLGLLVEWRGSVVPAITAHVGINFLNLTYISSRSRVRSSVMQQED